MFVPINYKKIDNRDLGYKYNKTSKKLNQELITSVKHTNESSTSMPNPLIHENFNFDDFYSRLKELSKTYRDFHQHEHELEESIKELLENKEDLLQEIQTMINHFNEAVKSLKEFDKAFDTDNLSSITNLLMIHEYQLKSYGITVLSDNELLFDKEKFYHSVTSEHKNIEFLFGEHKSVFAKLCAVFHDIKVPRKKGHNQSDNIVAYNGRIFDRRG